MTKKQKTATTEPKKTMTRIKKLITPTKKKAATDQDDDLSVESIKKAMDNLNLNIGESEQRSPIAFEGFLNELVALRGGRCRRVSG
jgi:hypothetical protein